MLEELPFKPGKAERVRVGAKSKGQHASFVFHFEMFWIVSCAAWQRVNQVYNAARPRQSQWLF